MGGLMRRCRWGLWAVALLVLAGCQGPGNAPLSLESRLRLAEAAASGDAGRLGVLREAARERPSDVALQVQYAQAAEQSGQFVEAAEALRVAMGREGASETRLLAIGRLLLRAGDGEGAAAAFEQAFGLAPRSAAAAAGLGLARDMTGDRAAAQAAYRRGLAVSPTDWTLRSNLGMSLVASGRPAEAVRVLGDAEFLPGAPGHARHNLALAYASQGQLERAVRVLRTDMGPSEAQAMAQEMEAFSRWLMPVQPVVAPEPPPVAGGRSGRRAEAETETPATPVAAAEPAPEAGGGGWLGRTLAGLRAGPAPPTETVAAAPEGAPAAARPAAETASAPAQAAAGNAANPPAEEAFSVVAAAPGAAAAAPAPAPQAIPVGFQQRVRAPAHMFGTPSVELATVPDVASASALWWRLSQRSPPLFSGLVPDIVQVDHERWSLRAVGLVGAGSAERFCTRLHRMGQNCTLASW